MVITEIGGTVGDIESQPFLEAIRQFALDVGKENCLYIHLTLVPYLKAAGELKTKPTQHSVGLLRQIGIQPDVLICRTERSIAARTARRSPCSATCPIEAVIEEKDKDFSIYEVPLSLVDNGLDELIVEQAAACTAEPLELDDWRELLHRLRNPEHEISIAVVGKYAEHNDAYKSIYEALDHAGIAPPVRRSASAAFRARRSSAKGPSGCSPGYDGILVPGGFGERGIEGKIEAIRYARERGIPFFGICLGMQCAVIEFARNVVGLTGAHSTEFNKDTPHPVICLLDEQRNITDKGGTMRLGAQPAHAGRRQPRAARPTAASRFSERHRHRYEFNNVYRQQFAAHGLRSPAPAPTASWSRSSSCPTIRGSWPCSSTPSSSRSRPPPSRCSPASSARRSTAANSAARAWRRQRRRNSIWRDQTRAGRVEWLRAGGPREGYRGFTGEVRAFRAGGSNIELRLTTQAVPR